MTELLQRERLGQVLRLTLRRPERGNALDDGLVAALLQAVSARDCALLTFRGAGRSFCTGLDLSSLPLLSDGDLVLRLLRIEQVLQAVHHAEPATAAFAQGNVFGAGADLFTACQHRIAAPDARFAFPGSRFGVALGTRRLALRVGGDAARDLVFRNGPLPAEEALAIGLVTEILPAEGWERREAELAERATARDAATRARLNALSVPDTRAADMAALVDSLVEGSLKARVGAYLKTLKT